MATEADIEVIEDNDEVVIFTCRVDGTPINLTGALIEMFVKPDKATNEADAGVIKYSTTGGEVTILAQAGDTLGQCSVQIDGSDVATPAKKRYRLDVTQNGRKLTFAYGRLVVRDV